MAFVQIIESRTTQPEALAEIEAEWERASEGRRLTRRRLRCHDRDDPGRHLTVVFFDSYEDAMTNSSLPETTAFAQRMAELTEQMTFYNLEVEQDALG